MSTDKIKNLDGLLTGSQSEVNMLKLGFPSLVLIISVICMDFHTYQTLFGHLHSYIHFNFRLLQGFT